MDKKLYIDQEALATLSLLKEGLLKPVDKLMNEKESIDVNQTKLYKGTIFPFSFILAPSGKRNESVLKSLKNGEKLTLVCEGIACGHIICDEVFKIDKDERIKLIYGTNNPLHHGVVNTYQRLGNYAISGEFEVIFEDIKKHKIELETAITNLEAKSISAIMLSGKPFHRIHERLIRTALVKNDLIVIFLLKPYTDDQLSYNTRYKTVKYFCDNFLPKDKVILIPLENTYIFGGFNEIILNAIVAYNYGCTQLILGKEKAGIGAFYQDRCFSSIADTISGIDIDIEIMSNFVYCNKCSTLVSTNACPHGSHHHIHYHNESIMELFYLGIIPPAILVRKEISSIILSDLFPQRTEKLAKIYQQLSLSSGLLDDFENKDFYENLMSLYQTSSLT
ncbi:MAG: sulfate adenylyltransferase [Epsilonproteobacteria bacterium]|nr:sulfate adenylyltransferase [Campylobacterota bacterium]